MSSSTPLAKVSKSVHEAEKFLASLTRTASQHEETRKGLLAIYRAQIAALESPLEVIWRMMMEPHQSAALRAAMGMGLVEPIASSESPKTASELASITGANKQLIVRILRPLTTMGIFAEVGHETYTATPITKILTVPSVGGGFKFMYDQAATSVMHMPQFLAMTSFANPAGPLTAFQSAFNTDLQLFPWLMQHPSPMSNFNDLMTGQRMNRIEWFDFADVHSIIFNHYTPADNSALLVDIGGGRGHDLEAFRNRFPDDARGQGKLVVQDLPPVIADIADLHADIVRQEYDFFTPQPVVGARAYYLRSIFHDYSDAKCREILQHVVKAMEPGYSKLLIFEWILPDTDSPLYPALLDINMMALFSGMERTEIQWRELLGSAGLEVVKFWTIGKETEGLIEAIRK
ncbi:Demethylsterigmatocystin 6-O-methyltransferase [Lachnellula occidentalis]|uniref:Demethylsterigmatocystin 6-O-methyltransferase n=1 Tax=Lachnellula occidentalis TaxID=215460 RepID=A0A8H8S924_9HELO|nr:Demethylsterigmatocystin 6-O-methyltransferase [Lachnellula occidentalis]